MREKRPVMYSVLFLIAIGVIFLGISVLVNFAYLEIPVLQDSSFYLVQTMADFLFFTVVFVYMKKTGYIRYFSERKTGYFKGLLVGGYFLFLIITNILIQIGAADWNKILPVQDIIFFFLAMFFIGLAEESTFRGVISNVLFESFKGSASGIRLSVLLSGIFFGLFHVLNSLGGQINFSSVMVQVLSTSAMGMLFAAIYYRTRNLWVVITLHAAIDLAALLTSGMTKSDSLKEVIGGYTAVNLVAVIPFIITTLILLRKSKMREIIECEQAVEGSGSDTSFEAEMNVETVATVEKKETKDYTTVVRIISICYILILLGSAIALSM